MEKRDFLTLRDLSYEEMNLVLERAAQFKSGIDTHRCPLIGKSIGLLFEKASTRTRVSLEAGIYQLGANAIFMNQKEIQLGRGETIPDTARVLSRYIDAVVIRTYSHETLAEFAAYSSVPVINGLSDLHHPCQALGDLMTIVEKKGRLKGIRLAYIGDGNNVANSLVEAAALTGMELVLACPQGYDPASDVLAAAAVKGSIRVVREPREAVQDADVVYTDVWISMGQEKEAEKKRERFQKYQLNSSLLSYADKDAIVMHCLPAHRGEEITTEVIDGPQSAVFDQAENRLHTQKALLEFLVK